MREWYRRMERSPILTIGQEKGAKQRLDLLVDLCHRSETRERETTWREATN